MNKVALFGLLGVAAVLRAGGGFVIPDQNQIDTEPTTMTELPFVDPTPLPTFTAAETRQGFMVFTRPLTAPVYPESKPLGQERIASLSTFGARGQAVNLNVILYPLRDLKGIEVSDSGGLGKRELRRVVYWKIRYPHYTSKKHYRRTPEYLFPQERPFDAPKYEPQRLLLTVTLPADAPAGKVRGALTIKVGGHQLSVPYAIEVLPFGLLRDPAKNFTAYNYERSRSKWHFTAKKHLDDPDWQHRAAINQYQKMKDYGFTMAPFLYLSYAYRKLSILGFDEYSRKEMEEVGLFNGRPVLVGSCGLNDLCWEYMKRGFSKNMTAKEFNPVIYEKIDQMLGDFLAHAKKNNYPPMIFAPIDEPSMNNLEIVRKIYGIFKKHGCTTYLTSCPFEEKVGDVVDYWSDQPFRSFQEVQARDKKLYWCYPNHNAYEIKDSATMCRGGRMTYGFGMWKSDYNVMIPWIWHTSTPKHLWKDRSSGGNFMADDASAHVTIYWECFREGIIDGQYLYTLSQAIVEREPATDPKLKALLKAGRDFLQGTWNAIPPLKKYLDSGHFSDEEFDGRRAAMAQLIRDIKRYPVTAKDRVSPSIIINPVSLNQDDALTALCQREEKRGNLVRRTVVSKEFGAYENESKMLSMPNGVQRFHILVDHQHDGTGHKDTYRLGWPRMRLNFKDALNCNLYDFMTFKLMVTSNRDGMTATRWPMHMQFSSRSFSANSPSFMLFDRLEPGEWKSFIFPLLMLRDHYRQNELGFSKIGFIQMNISESNYNHGDELNFDFKDVAFIGLKAPAIFKLDMTPVIEISRQTLPWRLSLLGQLPKDRQVQVEQRLLDGAGKEVRKNRLPMTATVIAGGVSLSGLSAGDYVLELRLVDPSGQLFAGDQAQELRRPLRLIAW